KKHGLEGTQVQCMWQEFLCEVQYDSAHAASQSKGEYREREAQLQCTDAAKTVAMALSKAVDPSCLDSEKAEAAAKTAGGEMWKGQLVFTFSKYAGQTLNTTNNV
ncbi:hypothetical protein GOODEAATRI_017673, partial [Goodea atripinnis]